MDHHSRFDRLLAATEELIHENERLRARFSAFEAALQEVTQVPHHHRSRSAA
jgi:hypothetical protein